MKIINSIFIFNIISIFSVIFDIPIVRQLFQFIYLSFFPGFLIIRYFEYEKSNIFELIFLSTGLSIFFVMIVGYLINEVFFSVGYKDPLSKITIWIFFIIITLLTYINSLHPKINQIKNIFCQIKINKDNIIEIINICLIPIFSLLSSLYNNVIFIILFIMFITFRIYYIIIISSKYKCFIKYELTIIVISLAILLKRAIIKNFLIGIDIFLEYYVANLTYNNMLWSSSILNEYILRITSLVNYNSILSITILPTIYTNFIKCPLIYVFKIIYPLLYSIVPLILFTIWSSKINYQLSFISTILFISSNKFIEYGNVRQMIGEIFLTLLIYILVNEKAQVKIRKFLFIIFSIALTISHYSLSLLFIFFISILFLFQYLTKIINKHYINIKMLDSISILFLYVFNFYWYTQITTGPTTNVIIIFKNIISQLQNFWNIEARGRTIQQFIQPFNDPTLIGKVGNIIPKILYFFIIIGVFNFIRLRGKNTEIRFDWGYALISLVNLSILIFNIILPGLAESFQAERWYHITLFFLAPFSVLGGIEFFRWIQKGIKSLGNQQKYYKKITINFICILFLFNFLYKFGLFYEILGIGLPSTSLSIERMMISDNKIYHARAYNEYTSEQEVFTSIWLSKYMNNNSNIYANPIVTYHQLLPYGNIDLKRIIILRNNTRILINSYIYFAMTNIINIDNIYFIPISYETNQTYPLDIKLNKICTNGIDNIYINHLNIRSRIIT